MVAIALAVVMTRRRRSRRAVADPAEGRAVADPGQRGAVADPGASTHADGDPGPTVLAPPRTEATDAGAASPPDAACPEQPPAGGVPEQDGPAVASAESADAATAGPARAADPPPGRTELASGAGHEPVGSAAGHPVTASTAEVARAGAPAPWLRVDVVPVDEAAQTPPPPARSHADEPRSTRPASSDGGPRPPGSAGSNGALAAAVANALANRAVADPGQQTRPASRGDARDRLLAALLNDPVRALGAAADLDSVRTQLDRLTEAMSHERSVLAQVLRRLAAAGLDERQIARLADLPAAEVRSLLERADAG